MLILFLAAPAADTLPLADAEETAVMAPVTALLAVWTVRTMAAPSVPARRRSIA